MNEDDKQLLYGDYRDGLKAQQKLYMKAAHKALDIPDDDMQINANRFGLSPAGVVAVALASGLLGVGGLGLGALLNRPAPAPPPAIVAPQPPATQKAEPQEWRIRWWVEDGKVKSDLSPIKPEEK